MSEAPVIDIDDKLRLLGTAHVATASVEAVRKQISEWQPDIVAVELCKSRYAALTNERRLDKEGLLKVIKEGKAPLVLIQSLLAAEQRRIGLDEGQQPGAELLAAVNAAEEADLEVALVDRDIQTTLRRAWKKMRLKEKVGLLWALISEEDDDISALASIRTQQDSVSVSWKAYGQVDDWRFLGKTPLKPTRLPRGILKFKLEKEGYETTYFSSSNPSLKFYNSPFDPGWNLEPINLQPQGSVPNGMIYIQGGNFVPALTGSGVDPVFLHPFYHLTSSSATM